MPVSTRTPLFPPPGETLLINQGGTGDCYLLAALDGLLKNKGTNDHIQDRFEELPDGSVRVRLKHCADSKNLAKNMKDGLMGGKYYYEYDKDADEDVFIISKEELARIDSDEDGVQTNSLAVKILEHLSSYYFNSEVAKNPFEAGAASVLMHNAANRFDKHGAEFVGQLLGVGKLEVSKAHGLGGQLHILRELKEKDANHPIYVGIDYGRKDAFGRFHGRHAFRLEGFVPNGRGGYDAILANPWDNRKVERFSEEELRERRAMLHVYDVSKLERPTVRKEVKAAPRMPTPEPAAGGLKKAPIPVIEHPKRVAPKPSIPVVTPKPAAPAVTPKPATPIVTPKPATPIVTPKPATPVVTPKPATPVVTPKPSIGPQPRVSPGAIPPPLPVRANLFNAAIQKLRANPELQSLNKGGFLLAGKETDPSAVLSSLFARVYIAYENFRTDNDLVKFANQCHSALEQALPPLDMRATVRIPKLGPIVDAIVSVMQKLDNTSVQKTMKDTLCRCREAQGKAGPEIDDAPNLIRPLH